MHWECLPIVQYQVYNPKATKLWDGWTSLEVRKQLTEGNDICTWSPCRMFCVCEGRKPKEQCRQRHGDLNTPHGYGKQQAVPWNGMEGDGRNPEADHRGPKPPFKGVWTSAFTRLLSSSNLCLPPCTLPFWMNTQETWLVGSFKISLLLLWSPVCCFLTVTFAVSFQVYSQI